MLRGLDRIDGFTFTPVESHGSQDEHDRKLSARDHVVGDTPHVRVDLVLPDNDIVAVLKVLRARPNGLAARRVYRVTPVAEFGGCSRRDISTGFIEKSRHLAAEARRLGYGLTRTTGKIFGV